MKVKLVNPAHAAGMIDPHTKRSPFIDPMTGEVLEVADVPDNVFWTRRLMDGELELELAGEGTKLLDTTPTGREPVAPLTKR